MNRIIASFIFGTLIAPALLSAEPRHLRVVWTESPESKATISFTSDKPGAMVHLDTTKKSVNEAYGRQIESASMSTYRGSNEVFHHVILDDLKPSTTYHFQLEADGEKSRAYHFTTAPSDDRPFQILYGGDSRTNIRGRQQVNKLIKHLIQENPGVIAFAHGGDYISVGEIWSQWDQWLDDHQLTVTDDGRVLPIIPARGNHEFDGFIYNQVFGFPGGTKRDYWVTKIGSDLTWITLDTNSSLGGDQKTFLEETLKGAQEARWIVANYHRPAFPAVKSIGPAYQHFVPLFEKYNVDFVCESDGHVLKRTVPIRNGMMDPTGVVYVGEGGLGVNQRTPDSSRWYLKPPGMTASAHHVQLFSFSSEQVNYRAVGLDLKDLDTYTFQPKRQGTYAPPEIVSSSISDTKTISIQFSEALDPLAIDAPGHVSLLSDHTPTTQVYDPKTRQLTIGLPPEATLPARLKITGLTDLSGQSIDDYVLSFENASTYPIAGQILERKKLERDKIAAPDVAPAPVQNSAPPIKSKGCSTGETKPTLWALIFFGFFWAQKKRRC